MNKTILPDILAADKAYEKKTGSTVFWFCKMEKDSDQSPTRMPVFDTELYSAGDGKRAGQVYFRSNEKDGKVYRCYLTVISRGELIPLTVSMLREAGVID